MAARINARIDPELAKKLKYVQRRTNKTTTQIVQESIALYYDTLRAEPSQAHRALYETGFVGGATGPKNLSTEYKKELLKALSEKA